METDRVMELIKTLGLSQHPEGGYFRETHCSNQRVVPHDDRGPRPAGTSIYFLLTEGDHSRWHVLRSDEVWHFYEGDPLELLVVEPGTMRLVRKVLGPSDGAQRPVHVVPAGHWQAARTLGAFTLVGCTVGPGFVFEDFQLLRDDQRKASIVRERLGTLADLL